MTVQGSVRKLNETLKEINQLERRLAGAKSSAFSAMTNRVNSKLRVLEGTANRLLDELEEYEIAGVCRWKDAADGSYMQYVGGDLCSRKKQ